MIALVAAAGIVLAIVPGVERRQRGQVIAAVRVLLRMMVAVGALVLVNHLYSLVAPAARGGIRMAVIALATMWLADLALYTAAYLGGDWPQTLIAARGIVMAAIVPVLAIAVHRNGDWTLNISRTVTWQSLTLVALTIYAMATVLVISAIEAFGGGYARLAQTAFVFGSAAALLTLLSSPTIKAWLRVMVAKHLFRHRYDYRAEWVRFTETLGVPGRKRAAARGAHRQGGRRSDRIRPPGCCSSPTAARCRSARGGNGRANRPPASPATSWRAFLADGAHIVELDSVRAGRATPRGTRRGAAMDARSSRRLGGGAAGPRQDADRRDPAGAPADRPQPRLGGFRPAPHRRAAGRELSGGGARARSSSPTRGASTNSTAASPSSCTT